MGELFGVMNDGISGATMQEKQKGIPVILAFILTNCFMPPMEIVPVESMAVWQSPR